MSTRFVLVALALAGVALRANAVEVAMGGVTINLPTPAGFCELKSNDPLEKRVIDLTADVLSKSGNRLLYVSADCEQLANWHSNGKPLEDYGQYQTAISLINAPVVAQPEEQTKKDCAVLRTQGDNLLSSATADVKSNVARVFDRIRLNETGFIGVVAEDPTACYAALLTKYRSDASNEITQVTVFALTFVKGKNVYVYRFARYRNADVVNGVLAKVKADVATLLAANRN